MSKPDAPYFEKKLRLVLRDIGQYTSEELALELYRLASTANPTIQSACINELGEQLSAMTQRAEAAEAREAALMEKLSTQKKHLDEFDELTDELTKGYGAASCINPVTDMRNAITKIRGLLESAEARIKASQEQEHVGVFSKDENNVWCELRTGSPNGKPLYAAPIIPPDVMKLIRENAELTRKLAEQQALFSKLTLMAWPNGNKEFLGEAGFEELTKSNAVPEGWQIVPKDPTEEMMIAGCGNAKDKSRWIADRTRIYKAMLAAAPQPETDRGSNE